MSQLGVHGVDDSGAATERLSAALLALEDRVAVDAAAGYAAAVELERRAAALGDEALLMRARLCWVDMLRRTGDVREAARQIKGIHAWARKHGDRRLQARAHLVQASIERLSGHRAGSLRHALKAVELLDETATAHMQVWHRLRLADALAENSDMDAARPRYRQAEELARELRNWERLLVALNNWAYSEYRAGNLPQAKEVARRMQDHAVLRGYHLDSDALDTIGAIQIANGEYAEAEQTMQICIARNRGAGANDADEMAEYLLTLARAQRGLGATDRALTSLHAAHTQCTERGLREVLVRVFQEKAELHAIRGEHTQAVAAKEALFAARESLPSPQRQPLRVILHALFRTHRGGRGNNNRAAG
ncbi:tetratricopeptide repeat protein [Krasilnikovia sp. M28-CT-15]|uniref:tetratricopeptide repeat protein n=1 Tax=Krasilnikovia sp. M28-CT-15 TaxID=3373540 RepID=UPI00399C6F5E